MKSFFGYGVKLDVFEILQYRFLPSTYENAYRLLGNEKSLRYIFRLDKDDLRINFSFATKVTLRKVHLDDSS